MDDWDKLKEKEAIFDRKRISGLCIACPEPYSNEVTSKPAVKATHRYQMLMPMCEKHYNETLRIVKAICG